MLRRCAASTSSVMPASSTRPGAARSSARRPRRVRPGRPPARRPAERGPTRRGAPAHRRRDRGARAAPRGRPPARSRATSAASTGRCDRATPWIARDDARRDAATAAGSVRRGVPGPGPGQSAPVERLEELLLTSPTRTPRRRRSTTLVDPRPLARANAYARVTAAIEDHLLGGTTRSAPDGSRSSRCSARRPATRPRRSPASCATSAALGRDLPGTVAARLLASGSAIGSSPRRSGRSTCRFGGGPVAGRCRRRPLVRRRRRRARARSATTAPGCPGSSSLAKSTYVWLDQLSRRYGRDIRTLDAIPDEELDALAGAGITGLWLIGLWQRSRASETIKRMRGNQDAVASAYSLDDYGIADDLGGEAAYASLRDRAGAARHPPRERHGPQPHGHRFALGRRASRLVHLGRRAAVPGVHVRRPEPRRPTTRVEIRIEDHYWDDSDAAVVFERRDRATGERRYVYHGNDGTSFPWNDTAQLDYLRAESARP